MSDEEAEEPSIEEILTSIRQIISDDDEEGGEDAPAEEKVLDMSEEAEEVPEYTPDEEVEENVPEYTPDEEPEENIPEYTPDEEPEEAPIPAAEPEEEEVVELTEPAEEEPVEEEAAIEVDLQEAEPEPEIPAPAVAEEDIPDIDLTDATEEESVLTDNARSAAIDGFSELAKHTAVEYNGITLEEIVRTELNPLLKVWLDKNLPDMIERLVREELEKISKRATEDE